MGYLTGELFIMRIRTLALATTLSLLGSTALVSNVQAQKGITLQPQTSWAVKRVNEGTSNAYCAVARRFKQNLILTVAKNSSRETSIALDFGKQSFTPGQSYKIVMDPGAGAQREFNSKPASDKAFVIRVGRDPQFISSLAKTGYLRVELNNETYNFNLADIDEGESHLDACLISMVKPAAGDESSVSALSVANNNDGAISALKNEKRKLESRLSALEQENASLKEAQKSADINPLPMVNSDSTLVASLKEQLEVLKAQNENLKNLSASAQTNSNDDVSIVALARENQRLKAMLDENSGSSISEEQLKLLSAKVSDLEKENLELTRKMQSASDNSSDTQELSKQIMALKSENKALRSSLDNGNIAQENFQELRENIKKLEQSNTALNERVESLAAEKASVVTQLSYYEDENDTLKSQLANASNTDSDLLVQLRKEIQLIESNNAKLLSGKEVEIKALQSELESLKTEKARLLSSNEAETRDIVKKFEAQTEAVRIKNEVLKEELVKLSKDQASLDLLKDKVLTLESEKQELALSLQESEKKMQDLGVQIAKLDNVSENAEQLKTEIASLDDQILVLESRNVELESALKNAQSSSAENNENLEALKSEISSLTEENKKLRSEVLTAASSVETQEQKVSILQKEKDELERQLAHKNSKAEEQIALLESQKLALQNHLDQQGSKQADAIALADKDKQYLQEQIDKLAQEKLELEQLFAEQNSVESQKVAALENEINELKLKEDKLSSELEALVLENQSLEEKLALTKETEISQIQSLENSLAALEKQNEKLSAEFEEKEISLQATIDNLTVENEQLQQTAQRMETQKSLAVEALNEEIAKAKRDSSEQISDLQNKAEENEETNLSLKEENEALNSQNKDLILALDNAAEFNEGLQKDWLETLDKLEALKIENAKFQNIVSAKQENADNSSAEIDALKQANAELSAKLKEQQKEFILLVEEYEALKASGMNVEVSADVLKDRDETIEALATDNKILKQEVSNLKSLINQRENSEYQEVSLQQKAAPLKPVKKPEQMVSDEDNGAQYASQEEQARENVRRMQSKASEGLEQEREEISKLVQVEPAAGDTEDFMDFEDAGLTEAQKLERQMKGQISRGPSISSKAPVIEETLPTVDAPQSVEVKVIEPEDNFAIEDKEIVEPETIATEIMSPKSAVEEKVVGNSYMPNVGIENILQRAGVQLSSNVEKVAKFSGPTNAAYQWKSSGNLYGSAQQKPIKNDAQFDEYVREYLTSTENRCSGDFAIIPSATSGMGQVRVDSYEIACVGAGVDSSASVVFFSQDGVFTVLAHEAPTESMDMAMEARDKIATSIGRS